MKNSILIIFGIFLLSCSTTKETAQSETVISTAEIDETAQREKSLADAGFIKVTVLNKEGEGGCGYLLQTEDKKLYQPLSWIEPDYKVAGKVIYVKYTVSKTTQSTCLDATPIMATEMKLTK